MNIYLDATTLIALGEIDELDLLTSFDGRLCVLSQVEEEVTTEPAKSNLTRFCTKNNIIPGGSPVTGGTGSLFREAEEAREEARRILQEDETNGDFAIVATIIILRNKGINSVVVSDDRRLRTVAEGLGARVTGTIGVVVRAVIEGELTEDGAKDLVRRLDSRGLHMTGELRETADELIEDAARENGDED